MATVYYNPHHIYHVEKSRTHPEDPRRVESIVSQLTPYVDKGITLKTFTHPTFQHESAAALATTAAARSWTVDEGDTYKTEYTELICGISRRMIMAAVSDLADNKTQCAFVLTRPPGHHASFDKKSGFCHDNNVFNAVEECIKRDKMRISVYDWDVHFGDGTYECLNCDDADYKQIKFASTHAFGRGIFPGTGSHEKTERMLVLPMRRGTTHDEFLETFTTEVLPFLEKPDILIVSAGYDGHMHDPMGLMNLHTETYGKMAQALKAIGCPVLFLLEGGYNPKALGESVVETLKPWIPAGSEASP